MHDSAPDGRGNFPAPGAGWPLWLALAAVAAVFVLRLPNVVQSMGPD
jgi:hypothetical protein